MVAGENIDIFALALSLGFISLPLPFNANLFSPTARVPLNTVFCLLSSDMSVGLPDSMERFTRLVGGRKIERMVDRRQGVCSVGFWFSGFSSSLVLNELPVLVQVVRRCWI